MNTIIIDTIDKFANVISNYSSNTIFIQIQQNNITDWIIAGATVVSVVISIILISVSISISKTANRLEESQKDSDFSIYLSNKYSSDEIQVAVRYLWKFYRCCVEIAKKKYNISNEFLDSSIKKFTKVFVLLFHWNQRADKKHSKEYKNGIDKKRKIVKSFYHHLAVLYKRGMIEDGFIFSIWGHEDLEIIPRIILPLEIELWEDKKQIHHNNKYVDQTKQEAMKHYIMVFLNLYKSSRKYIETLEKERVILNGFNPADMIEERLGIY
jgi:hypothetical protein